jgi:hypothetical protein
MGVKDATLEERLPLSWLRNTGCLYTRVGECVCVYVRACLNMRACVRVFIDLCLCVCCTLVHAIFPLAKNTSRTCGAPLLQVLCYITLCCVPLCCFTLRCVAVCDVMVCYVLLRCVPRVFTFRTSSNVVLWQAEQCILQLSPSRMYCLRSQSERQKSVIRVLQGGDKDVPRVLQGCYKSIIRVFLCSLRVKSSVLDFKQR